MKQLLTLVLLSNQIHCLARFAFHRLCRSHITRCNDRGIQVSRLRAQESDGGLKQTFTCDQIRGS